jgi:hypothetical protein
MMMMKNKEIKNPKKKQTNKQEGERESRAERLKYFCNK